MADLATTVGLYNGPRAEMEEDWDVVRTLGEDTPGMRRARERFTPRTERETDKRWQHLYEARLKATTLDNVYARTVSKIASLPFQKPPTVGEVPKRLQKIETNADRMGASLSMFAQRIYHDAVDRGIGWFLVDNVPTVTEDGSTMNRAEVEDMDARPYFVRIPPDNLVGFDHVTKNGREVVTELRVREWVFRRSDDGIRDELVERIRRWDQTNVELWERQYTHNQTTALTRSMLAGKGGDGSSFKIIQGPTPHGFPDNEIPLVAVTTRETGFSQGRPPLLGLAWQNVKHWNQQSIHDNALRYNLSPILLGTGFDQEDIDNKPKMGEGAIAMTRNKDARLDYVEISGSSFDASDVQIRATEARMLAHSMDPLIASSGPATATGEVRAEENQQSEAQRWIEGCEWAFWRAYHIAAKWVGEKLPEDFNVGFYRASSLIAAKATDMALIQADAREGRIGTVRYLTEAKRRGIYADDMDPEDEAEAMRQEAEENEEKQFERLKLQLAATPDTEDDEQETEDVEDEEQEARAAG